MAAAGRKEALCQVAGAVSQHATGARRQGRLIQGAIVANARQGVVHGVTQELGRRRRSQLGTNFLDITANNAGLLVRTSEGGWLHLGRQRHWSPILGPKKCFSSLRPLFLGHSFILNDFDPDLDLSGLEVVLHWLTAIFRTTWQPDREKPHESPWFPQDCAQKPFKKTE